MFIGFDLWLFFLIAFLVIAQAWASGITSQASASRLLFGMARDGRLPHKLFGYIHPTRRTPIYSVLLMGGIACAGGLVFDLDTGAELVNFGACLGFMAVNLSVLAHYFVRLRLAFRPGVVGFFGIIGYANLRFALEFLRDDFRGFAFGTWLSTSQFISICVLATCAITIPFWVRGSRVSEPVP